MYCYSCVSEHGLNTSSSYDDLFGWILFQLICKVYQHSKLYRFVIAWDLLEGSLLDWNMIYLDLGNSSLQDGGPVYDSV